MLDKLKIFWSKTNRWHRVLFIFILIESNILPGGQVGFTCNDPALSYPYTGDTISWKTLLATTFLLPLVMMLIVEKKYHGDKETKPKKQALRWYKEYTFGIIINLTIIQTLKLLVGSPRPHFFDTCNPKEAVTCQGSEYVHSYTCTKAHWLNQSDKSFPSGHTSLSLQTAFFLMYYLHKRTVCSYRSRAILSVQLLLMVTAIFCCFSRMTDHRHHWWDVLAGALVVPPVLLYTTKHLCGDFECSSDTRRVSSHTSDSNDGTSHISDSNDGTSHMSESNSKKIIDSHVNGI